MNFVHLFRTGAVVAVALALAACGSPLQPANLSGPSDSANSVTVSINKPMARSGLISINTAQAKADTYEIILYNATDFYRTIASSTSATLTNIKAGTYGLLVLAGISNGATIINGTRAFLLVGSGDIPYTPGKTLTGTPDGYDGSGITVSGPNTPVSVNLQNIIFKSSASGSGITGSNPYTTSIGTTFTVDFSYDLFLNQFAGTGTGATIFTDPSANVPRGPLALYGYGASIASNIFTGTSGLTWNSSSQSFPTVTNNSTAVFSSTYTAPAVGGSSNSLAFDAAGQLVSFPNNNGGHLGKLWFVNPITLGAAKAFYALAAPQSGTSADWYLPSPSMSTAYAALGITGTVTVNFSAPGAAVTVGWGAGR